MTAYLKGSIPVQKLIEQFQSELRWVRPQKVSISLASNLRDIEQKLATPPQSDWNARRLFWLEFHPLPLHLSSMSSDDQPSSNALPDGVRIVPMAIPGWDAGRAADSFRAFAQYVHGMAKDILLRDSSHAEMLFLVPLHGKGQVALWGNPDRDLQVSWIRRHIADNYIFGVAHVVEGWMRLAPTTNDHILKQVMAGEIKVSELRPEHRKEALMVSAQSRDGWAISWVDEIVRIAGDPVLGGCQEIKDFEGRFGKLFG